jgi:hypothetical protein
MAVSTSNCSSSTGCSGVTSKIEKKRKFGWQEWTLSCVVFKRHSDGRFHSQLLLDHAIVPMPTEGTVRLPSSLVSWETRGGSFPTATPLRRSSCTVLCAKRKALDALHFVVNNNASNETEFRILQLLEFFRTSERMLDARDYYNGVFSASQFIYCRLKILDSTAKRTFGWECNLIPDSDSIRSNRCKTRYRDLLLPVMPNSKFEIWCSNRRCVMIEKN